MGAVRGELTAKQMHFARCIASGMKQAEAYREAYNVGENTKPSTCHEKASRLMAQDKIRARVDMLVALRDKALIRSSVDLRTKVLRKLEDFADTAEPQDAVKLRATELLGKSIGMFREVIDDGRNDGRSSDELIEELHERLRQLADDKDGPTLN